MLHHCKKMLKRYGALQQSNVQSKSFAISLLCHNLENFICLVAVSFVTTAYGGSADSFGASLGMSECLFLPA